MSGASIAATIECSAVELIKLVPTLGRIGWASARETDAALHEAEQEAERILKVIREYRAEEEARVERRRMENAAICEAASAPSPRVLRHYGIPAEAAE